MEMKPGTGSGAPGASRRSAVTLFLLSLALLWLYPVGSWPKFIEPNQSSRAMLTLALYERGDVHVDPEIKRYCRVDDLARYQGRHYSNKPPGSSIWLLLFTPLIDALTPGRIRLFELVHYGRILAVTLPWLAFLFFFARFLERFCGFAAAWGLIALCALATNAGMYATVFFGHNLAAAALGAALILLCRPGPSRPAAAGFLSGFALITELQSLWVFPFLAAFAAWSAPSGRRLRHLAGFLAGAAPPAAVLLAYNWLCFGDPFTMAYRYEINRYTAKVYSATFYAMKGPNLTALYGILIGPSRGLLLYSPWLWSLLGWIRVFGRVKDPMDRKAAVLSLAVPAAVILALSGYRFWDGGFSFGMRYLILCYPFFLLSLALLWKYADRLERVVLACVLAAGGALAWAVHSVGFWMFPFSPSLFADIHFNPIRVFVWPMLQHGHSSCTLATLSGLPVRVSLMIFAALQVAALCAAVWLIVGSVSRARRRLVCASGLAGLLLFAGWLQVGQSHDTSYRKQIRKWLETRVAYHDRQVRLPIVGNK